MDKFVTKLNKKTTACTEDAEELSNDEGDELELTESAGSQATSLATQDIQLPSTSSASDTNPWPFLDKYFTFTEAKGQSLLYKCNLCIQQSKLISANNRSLFNLKKHVNRVHPLKSKEINDCIADGAKARKRNLSPDNTVDTPKKVKQQSIEKLITSNNRSVTQSTVDTKIVTLFIDGMLPLEVVESLPFVDLITTLKPNANVMSRRTLTRKIEDKFVLKSTELKEQLSNPNVESVATTADAWSCRNRSYLGMTVHWIDESTMKRKKSVLACRRLEGRHTYDVLAKMIETIHMDFRIEDKVVKCTTDNGSNFVKAFKVFSDDDSCNESSHIIDANDDADEVTSVTDIASILEESESNAEEFYVLPKHIRCAAHTLNLVASSDADKALGVSNGYKKAFRSAFAKSRELWNKQNRSTQAADVIKSELGRMLIVPTATRWNSVYDAVSCLVTLFETKTNALNRVCSSLKIPLFTSADIAFLKEYAMVMKPLAVSLDIIQGEEKAFMGLLLPVITACLQKLKAAMKKMDYCSCLVLILQESIKTRFKDQLEDEELVLASAFHPQFKLNWLQNELQADKAKTMMIKLVDNKLQRNHSQVVEASSGSEDDSENFLLDILKPSKKPIESEGKRLVDNYLESPLSTALPHPQSFPCQHFIDLFMKYNTPIPSSAAVERLFSVGKDILKPKRSSLSDKHFEMLVFLKGK